MWWSNHGLRNLPELDLSPKSITPLATLHRLPHVSEPQFLHLGNGDRHKNAHP